MKNLSFDGLDSEEKTWAYVNTLFELLDINKDGQLDFNELKPFLTKYLQDEYDIEPGK